MNRSVQKFLQTAIFQRPNLKMGFQTRASMQVKIRIVSHSILTHNRIRVWPTYSTTSGPWEDNDMCWAVCICNKYPRPNKLQISKCSKRLKQWNQISESHFPMNLLWHFTEVPFRCNTIIKLNIVVVRRIDLVVILSQQYAWAFS